MGKTVTPRQRRAIEALLTTASITQAAEQAGCARRTLYRWLREPDFLAELHRCEDLLYEELRRTLGAGRDAALKALLELIRGARSESVRRGAASDWLSLYVKLHEMGLEDRLERLEEAIFGRR